MVLNVHRNRTAYQGRGEGGEGGRRWDTHTDTYTDTHARTHTHAHTRARARTHAGRPGVRGGVEGDPCSYVKHYNVRKANRNQSLFKHSPDPINGPDRR